MLGWGGGHSQRSIIMMIPLFALLAVFCRPELAFGATIHVDSSLPVDCVGTYNPAKRSCGSGDAVAYRTLGGAASAVRPGDTVLIRRGTYKESLIPHRQGAPDNYISFKSYPGETATLNGLKEPAISIFNGAYLIIEGLDVDDVQGWGRVESSEHIIIRRNRFSRATAHGTTGGLKFVKSAFNRVLNNVFDDGNDSLVLQESDRNLVQGNVFTKARHSLLSIRCGNINVIRDNRFHNSDQKAAEIYDCEGVSDAPVKLDATKHNLFESNAFTHTRAADRNYRYNGIQYSGQSGIVRKNIFYENMGGALNFQVYEREALYNYRNHVYNNTFFNNRCYAISASSAYNSSRYFGNILINNILYGNKDCTGGGTQTSIENSKAVRMGKNAVLKESPQFANESMRDFHIASGSPMIDAGVFATRTVGKGNGKILHVEDAGYFYDGFGIDKEAGDSIQLEGQSVTARIIGIDYAKNILTLDRPLAWENGQNLHLEFSGLRPDMGAYEY